MVHHVELRMYERVDALATGVEAATHRHEDLRRLFVEISDGDLVGYGEITPLANQVGDDPGVDDVRHSLVARALPSVVDIVQREGELPSWGRAHLLSGSDRALRWSMGVVEMALLDLDLVRSGDTLEKRWQLTLDHVPSMATTSLLDLNATWTPPAGTCRVRLKTSPIADVTTWLPLISSWGLPVLLDFNASARTFDDVAIQVAQLERAVELVAVEQPFAPGDLASPALLARRLGITVSLDEGVRSIHDVRRIARYEAASLVCVKPARVGGVAVARSILAEAIALGLRVYVGGFFDAPLARRAHTAVAAGFDVEASDVAVVLTRDARNVDTARSVGIGVVPDLSAATRVATFEAR